MSEEIISCYGSDPIALCTDWMREAAEAEPNDPTAACLATSDKQGHPSARMILIKDVSEKGFKFHTNSEGRKGQELKQNPFASLCLYWKSTRKQIRIEGRVKQVNAKESDTYFKTRPLNRQIGAWASDQSRSFEQWNDLQTRIQEEKQRFSKAKEIPRPPYWNGYRLIPDSLEFWIGSQDRLHTRFIYKKTKDGMWSTTWLYP